MTYLILACMSARKNVRRRSENVILSSAFSVIRSRNSYLFPVILPDFSVALGWFFLVLFHDMVSGNLLTCLLSIGYGYLRLESRRRNNIFFLSSWKSLFQKLFSPICIIKGGYRVKLCKYLEYS